MEPVLFYGVPSGCSFGSIVALEWLGRPYRLARITMPDDMQDDLYARFNPVRETPVLVTENGEPLSESMAILSHVAALGIDRGLGFAQGTPAFDRLNQALAWLNTSFFSAFNPLWRAYEMEENLLVQDTLRQVGGDDVRKVFGQLDAILAGRDWIADTPAPTVADAYFTGIVRWVDYHGISGVDEFRRVAAYRRKLEADPAVSFARTIEAGEEPAGSGAFQGHARLEEILPRLR